MWKLHCKSLKLSQADNVGNLYDYQGILFVVLTESESKKICDIRILAKDFTINVPVWEPFDVQMFSTMHIDDTTKCTPE